MTDYSDYYTLDEYKIINVMVTPNLPTPAECLLFEKFMVSRCKGLGIEVLYGDGITSQNKYPLGILNSEFSKVLTVVNYPVISIP